MNALVKRRSSRVTQASEASLAERRVIKPDPQWRIIAGVHVESNGDLAVAWLGLDRGSIHLYDSWVFRRSESVPFIVDAIKQRGEWIPLVFAKGQEDIAGKLGEKGCRILRGNKGEVVCYDDSEELASWISREINAGLNAGTFIAWDTNQEWLKEYDHFMERDGVVPQEGSPLMSATRHAFHFRKHARTEAPKFRKITYDRRGLV